MQQHHDATVTTRHHDDGDGHKGAFNAEHGMAYAVIGVSLVLGVIGLLRGFGILGGGADVQDISTGAPGTQAASYGSLWDSAVWFLPAIALAFTGWALHMTRHHRIGMDEDRRDSNEGAFKTEHMLAYLMGAATIAAAVLGILVGFDLLGRGNDQPDALPWLFAALHYGVLTAALHNSGHHLPAEAPSYLTSRVVERVSQPAPPVTTSATPTYEAGHMGDTERGSRPRINP